MHRVSKSVSKHYISEALRLKDLSIIYIASSGCNDTKFRSQVSRHLTFVQTLKSHYDKILTGYAFKRTVIIPLSFRRFIEAKEEKHAEYSVHMY